MSFADTVVLFVLALLLFGPKKLPVIARQIGKALNEFKRASIMKSLQDFIGGQQGLRVFYRRILQAGLQFHSRIARRQFQGYGLGHV